MTLLSFVLRFGGRCLGLLGLWLPMLLSAEPARVIVKYHHGTLANQAPTTQRMSELSLRSGMTLRSGRAVDALTHVVTADGMSSGQLADQLKRQPGVAYAVVDRRLRLASVPNDPLYTAVPLTPTSGGPLVGQWYLKPPSAELVSAVNAEGAWAITSGSADVVVAILDSGLTFNHPEFLRSTQGGNFLEGWDFVSNDAQSNDGSSGRDANAADPGDWVTAQDLASIAECSDNEVSHSSWHGTRTAGLIGASSNNSLGIASIAPRVRVLPVRVIGKCAVYDSDLITAARWAAGLSVPNVADNPTPAQVINISLSGEGDCSEAYRDALASMAIQGTVVVAAAGNDAGHSVGSPANCPGLIGVAAVRHAGTKVGYSNLGAEIALSAPGGNCSSDVQMGCRYAIVTTSNPGLTFPIEGPFGGAYSDSFKASLGTSMSAPMVAGAAALMLSVNPRLSPQDLRDLLRQSARPFPTTGAEAHTVDTCRLPVATRADPNNEAQQLECYCTTETCGAGLLDIGAATQLASTRFLPRISVSPNPPLADESMTFSAGSSLISSERRITTYRWRVLDGGGIATDFAAGSDTPTASLKATGPGRVVIQLTLTDDQNRSATSSLGVDVVGGDSGGGALHPLSLLALGLAVWALRCNYHQANPASSVPRGIFMRAALRRLSAGRALKPNRPCAPDTLCRPLIFLALLFLLICQ